MVNKLDTLQEIQMLFKRMVELIVEHKRTDLRYCLSEMKYAINLIDIGIQDNDYEKKLIEVRAIMKNLYRQTRDGLSEFHIWPDRNGVNSEISQINDRLLKIYWELDEVLKT